MASSRTGAVRAGGAAEGLALAALLAGGLGLRLWGLAYGLPHPTARPDEEVLVAKLLGFDAGDPNPHWFIYPSFYLYLLYGWVKALLVAAQAAALAPTASLAGLAAEDPGLLYVVARSLAALLGTGTILVTFLLGRAVWDARAGLAAAAMLAVAFVHVRDSHFFKPDAAQSFFTAAALLGCVRLDQRGSLRRAAAAGVWCGLALGVKYNLALLLPLGLAAILGRPATSAGAPKPWWRLIVAGATAAGALLLTSPYIVLDWAKFAAWLTYARLGFQYAAGGPAASLRYHVETSFLLGEGPLLSLVVLGAVVAQVTLRPLLPLTIFVVASLGQLVVITFAYTRYLTPLLPALYVVAGVALTRLVSRLRGGRTRMVVAALALIVLLGRPLAQSIAFDRIAARADTRLLAREWLEGRVPPATPILVLGARWPHTYADPVLKGYRVFRNPTLDPKRGIAYVVTHEHPLPFSRVPADFAALAPRLRLEATFSPFAGDTPPPGATFEMGDAFYLPLAGFGGVIRGGPLIRIYSVAPPDGARVPAPGSARDLEEPNPRPPGAQQ